MARELVMECATVADRVAPYLDGELAPSEIELVDAHLDECAECRALVHALSRQAFSAADASAVSGQADFWAGLDAVMTRELDAQLGTARNRRRLGRLFTRSLRVSPVALLAYAALLLLSLAWGAHNLQETWKAEARANALTIELEREQRLAAEPTQLDPLPGYTLTRHTPHRANF